MWDSSGAILMDLYTAAYRRDEISTHFNTQNRKPRTSKSSEAQFSFLAALPLFAWLTKEGSMQPAHFSKWNLPVREFNNLGI
jgi:hypothetical protein